MIDRRLPGLAHPTAAEVRPVRLERRWRLPLLLSLLGTIPAFYLELLTAEPGLRPALLYAAAAVVTLLALAHVAAACADAATYLRRNALDVVLVCGLLLAALLPPSSTSEAALGLRSAVALAVLVRAGWTLRPMLNRGSLPYLLLLALGVLGLCGLGFWWLEPTAHSYEDGLWLAFTTAATVGYGDLVPTTAASRIFSVFVVLLGLGVLTLVTAAIAAQLVESEERRIEREILRDVHHQLRSVHAEVKALRDELRDAQERASPR